MLKNPAALLTNLNPQQAQAVQTVNGPVLVLAGPGSGKTGVLTRRIAYLIEVMGIAPWNILAVTFTNKAAREMRERVEKLLEEKFGLPTVGEQRSRLGGLTIGTFHSICARILRVETEAVNYDRNWVIYDSADQLSLIRNIMRELNLDEKRYSPNAIQSRISSQKNEMISPQEYRSSSYFEEIAGRVYTRYQGALLTNNAMDFDDLLFKSVLLFRQRPDLLDKYQKKWPYLMVDEFQDTNKVQYELVHQLANAPGGQRNLFVVGDEDQCVLPGTLITTKDGLKAVETLISKDVIVAAAGHSSIAHGKTDAIPRRPYVGPTIKITTVGGKELVATPEHCVFARFQPNSTYHYAYLMFSKKLGYRIGRTGAIRTNGEKEYPAFRERLRQERGDAIWLLKAASEPAEAAYWESFYAAKYGLPTACFYAGGRQLTMRDEQLRRLYGSLDTHTAAERLAEDLGISLAHPHHTPQATIRGGSVRKNISFTMFGAKKTKSGADRWHKGQDAWHLHELSIASSCSEFRRQVETVLPTRPRKEIYWGARSTHGDYDVMEQTLAALVNVCSDVHVWKRAKLTDDYFDFMPIGHVVPGALVPVLDDKGTITEDEVVAVDRGWYEGLVYDLSVPVYRNYVANGIVVHNSIYRWRGADYQNVLRFKQNYPEAVVILLEQNYRSTQTILNVANSVINNNRNRTAKQLHTENGLGKDGVIVYEAYNEIEEAAYVCDEIERLMSKDPKLGLGDFAVMYRTNAQSRALEEVFVRRQIKHKLVGATRFYERKEIKDALSYLRLVHNPTDTIAMDRIINEPSRGIGTKTYAALKEWAAAMKVSEYTALLILRHGPDLVNQATGGQLSAAAYKAPDLGSRAKNALTDFARLLESWITLREANRYEHVADLIDLIMRDSGYVDTLRDGSDEGEDRFANLQELYGVAAQYMPGMPALEEGQTPISLFLQEVSLVSDQDQVEEGGGAVTLLTLHTAKGLEFPIVFMVGLEEGILPHSRSMESNDPEDMAEERRLCYVGITRAKRRLYLVHVYRRTVWGSSEMQEPSRFLEEIPADLLAGMVDRQSRRRASYERATTWDGDDDDFDNRRPRQSSRPSTQRNPYNWSSQGSRAERSNPDRQRDEDKSSGSPKQKYWSPGENQPITRPAARPESQKATSGDRKPQFNRRDSVQHAKFGVGTVIESQVTRDDEEVTVAFPGVGIKKLSASMAGLKKL